MSWLCSCSCLAWTLFCRSNAFLRLIRKGISRPSIRGTRERSCHCLLLGFKCVPTHLGYQSYNQSPSLSFGDQVNQSILQPHPITRFAWYHSFPDKNRLSAVALLRAWDLVAPNYHNSNSAWRGYNTHPGPGPPIPGLSRPRQTSSGGATVEYSLPRSTI